MGANLGRALSNVATGAISGVIATTVMSTGMLAAQRAGLLGEMPPRKVARALRRRATGQKDPRRERRLAALVHYLIGGSAGAFYALVIRRRVRSATFARVSGTAFGMVVWATGYLGVLPAANVMPLPHRDRPGRPTTMIAAHLVYGYVLGAMMNRSTRLRRAAPN